MVPTPRKKKAMVIKEKQVKAGRKREPCNHASYSEGLYYAPEIMATWCHKGYYLFGIGCDGCGSKFVERVVPPVGQGSTEKDKTPQIPSTNNPVYCCINIRGRDGSFEETGACSHAVCFGCWNKGIIAMDDAPRSRRARKIGWASKEIHYIIYNTWLLFN